MNSKRGYLQISFQWIFAIIVGAIILFLAIYGLTKVIKTEETSIDAQTGKEIGILLNPLETEFLKGTVTSLTLPAETRIYCRCNNYDFFGNQIIRISQKSFNKWTETNIDVNFPNKYIFAEDFVEGKRFYVFSKPFEFPFKIANLIYLTSFDKNYCFVNAPENIEREIRFLGQKNFFNATNKANCPEKSIKVCFNSNCDISINYDAGYVKKYGEDENLYFETDALMYGAIFSDSKSYECQVQRLMKRTEQLAEVYDEKATFIKSTGCNTNLNLAGLKAVAGNLEDSSDLRSVGILAENIEELNDNAGCELW